MVCLDDLESSPHVRGLPKDAIIAIRMDYGIVTIIPSPSVRQDFRPPVRRVFSAHQTLYQPFHQLAGCGTVCTRSVDIDTWARNVVQVHQNVN
jgi:hypothetical protein